MRAGGAWVPAVTAVLLLFLGPSSSLADAAGATASWDDSDARRHDPISGRGSPAIEVPLRIAHGWFVVPVLLDDSVSLEFIVDTGAGMSAVTRSTLERLGRATAASVRAKGASGAQELPLARLGSLSLPGLRAFNPSVLVLDDRVLTPRVPGNPDPYDGVLGADLLAEYDVLLDPIAGVLRLFSPGEAAQDALPRLAEAIPLWRIAGPILGHDVQINGSVMPAILDTGSRRVVVSPRAARNARVQALPGTAQSGQAGVGTREVTWEDVDLERVRAGTTELGSMAAQVGALPIFHSLGFADRAVVLLGNPALRGCPVLISYERDTVRYCESPQGS